MYLYPKPIIIATCCAIAIVATFYFAGRYYLSQGHTPDRDSPEIQAVTKVLKKATPTHDKRQSPSLEAVSQIEPDSDEMEVEPHPTDWNFLGDESPPEGYYYFSTYDGQRLLWPYNEPYVKAYYGDEYAYGRFHQLTEEEHVRYIVFQNIANNKESIEKGMRTFGFSRSAFTIYPDEVIVKAKEWADLLYEKTYGPNVLTDFSGVYNRKKTQTDDERENSLWLEKCRELEPRYHHSPTVSATAGKEITTELFAAVGMDYKQYLDDRQVGYPKMGASITE